MNIVTSKAPLTSTTSDTPLWLTLLFTISGAILVLGVSKNKLKELKDK